MNERPGILATADPHRIEVIANPVSGKRKNHSRLPVFLETLRAHVAAVHVELTRGPGHATDLARAAETRDPDVIVAVGGDGTVNEVLNGLERRETALATLPLGTSSILAHELSIPRDPRAAAAVLLRGKRRRLDVGRVNGRRFLMVVGIGWDGYVVKAFTEARKGHSGKHRYVAPILRALREYDFPEMSVSVDGKPARRTARVAFACNIRNYAAWFRLAPDARPDDGQFDFVLFRKGSARACFRWAVGALLGTLPRYREVDYQKGRTLLIDAARPVPFEVDGDPGGTTPVRIEMESRSQEVIVP